MTGKKANILLSILLISSLSLVTIIYSALNTEMMIDGSAILRVDDDIRITDLKVLEQTSGAYETYNNKFDKERTSIFVTLPNTDSTITYQVTITNKSDKIYYLMDIIEESITNSNMKYELIGINIEDLIEGNTLKTFMIKFYYDSNVLPKDTTNTLILKYHFELDTISPTWSVESISKDAVKTTEEFTFRIMGTDDHKEVTSKLDISNIEYLVNGNSSSPIASSLQLISSDENKVIYELTVAMLGGSGNLKINIGNGTLIDQSGNNSPSLLLDTGINLSKDDEPNILVWKDYNSKIYSLMSNYYSNITLNESISTSEIISSNYDLVIYYRSYWEVPQELNTLFDAGINLIAQGNDGQSDYSLYINASADYIVYDSNTIEVNKVAFNNLTKYMPDSFIERDESISLWHFASDAKVLYQATYDGVNYDKIGYIKRNNTIWFHLAVPYLEGDNYVSIAEFIHGDLAE